MSWAMTWPARSVTVSASGSFAIETTSLAVLKPTATGEDSGATGTLAVRAAGSTDHEASSGNWPSAPTRTRMTSSRRAVICIKAAPERISMPFGSAREAVTRSSRTKAEEFSDFPVVCACDVAAENKSTKTANRRFPVFFNEHLKGAFYLAARITRERWRGETEESVPEL